MLGYNILVVSNEALLWFLLVVPVLMLVAGYHIALAQYEDWRDDCLWTLPEGTPHATLYIPSPRIEDDMLPVTYTTPYMTRCEDDLTYVEGIH